MGWGVGGEGGSFSANCTGLRLCCAVTCWGGSQAPVELNIPQGYRGRRRVGSTRGCHLQPVRVKPGDTMLNYADRQPIACLARRVGKVEGKVRWRGTLFRHQDKKMSEIKSHVLWGPSLGWWGSCYRVKTVWPRVMLCEVKAACRALFQLWGRERARKSSGLF